MKFFVLFCFLFLISSLGIAQDTLLKKDGTVLVGIVKEIDDLYVTYVWVSQPNGPMRKAPLYEIANIHYKDGTLEEFNVETRPQGNSEAWEPGTINNTGKIVVIARRGRDLRIHPGERFPE